MSLVATHYDPGNVGALVPIASSGGLAMATSHRSLSDSPCAVLGLSSGRLAKVNHVWVGVEVDVSYFAVVCVRHDGDIAARRNMSKTTFEHNECAASSKCMGRVKHG